MHSRRLIRSVIAVAAIGCATAAAGAAAAVDIACVSLIGDVLTTIEREPTSGSNVAKRRGVANAEPARERDKLAANAAMRAITARSPSTTVATVEVSGAGTEPFFRTPLGSINDADASALYAQLASGIARQVDAKRVLVIAKLDFRHWSEPYILNGIGVFAEPGPRDALLDEEMVARRYVAPYVGAALLPSRPTS